MSALGFRSTSGKNPCIRVVHLECDKHNEYWMLLGVLLGGDPRRDLSRAVDAEKRYLQARSQGGFEGVRTNPPCNLVKLKFYFF